MSPATTQGPSAPVSSDGLFVPVQPFRMLDTRESQNSPNNGTPAEHVESHFRHRRTRWRRTHSVRYFSKPHLDPHLWAGLGESLGSRACVPEHVLSERKLRRTYRCQPCCHRPWVVRKHLRQLIRPHSCHLRRLRVLHWTRRDPRNRYPRRQSRSNCWRVRIFIQRARCRRQRAACFLGPVHSNPLRHKLRSCE